MRISGAGSSTRKRKRATPGGSVGHRLLCRSCNQTFALRFLARQLACPPHRFASFPRRLFRRLLVESSALHLAEDAFALHLLFEDSESLVDIVVANEDLQ